MATILLVDDEPIIRQLFKTVLEHQGHTILTACNGQEALDVLREGVPDLVLLDVMMPQMDGISLLRLMRRNAEWADIPVVIISAAADRQQIKDAGLLGVRDYVLKAGFSLPVLRNRISKYLAPLRQEAEFAGASPATMVE